MFTKINLSKIILDHINTLRDSSGRVMLGDFLLFFGIPAIFAILVAITKFEFKTEMINLLVTSLSIFAALLFNLLLLIYDIIRKTDNGGKLKAKFLKEIYSNISFSILVSILAVILLLISFFDFNAKIINKSIDALAGFLLTSFLLTLFMILKRVHILLSKEFEEAKTT